MSCRRVGGITLIGLTATSCVLSELRTADAELFIVGVMSLKETDCIASPSSNAPLLASGVFDVALTGSYVASLLVGNQLVERSPERFNTEFAVTLDEIVIEVFDLVGGHQILTRAATGFVGSPPESQASYAAIFAPLLLSAETGGGGSVSGECFVKVRVAGETLSGKRVSSNEFGFSIKVCEGCLVSYPPEANVNAGGEYTCGAYSVHQNRPCFLGQDEQLPCSECAISMPICRDPSRNPWFSDGLP